MDLVSLVEICLIALPPQNWSWGYEALSGYRRTKSSTFCTCSSSSTRWLIPFHSHQHSGTHHSQSGTSHHLF